MRRVSLADELAAGLIMLLALAVGAFVRLQSVNAAGFPLNDGGLFYVMAQDVAKANFALPAVSSYNGIAMPFAYPPLAFYLAAILNRVFNWPLIEIVRYFPAALNILTIPAFYLLARTMLKVRLQAALAVFVFALLPRSFKWLIMGGGLTRSLGFFFAVLAVQQVYLLYTTRQRRHLIPAIVLCALTLLSHPEMAAFAACSVIVFWFFFWRTREGVVYSAALGFGTLIVAAPWWLTVIGYHGLTPLLAAFQTGEYSTYPSVAFLLFSGLAASEQVYLGFVGLLGLVKQIADGKLLLPCWFLAIYLISPRSAPTFASIPLALLAAIFVEAVLFTMIRRTGGTSAPDGTGGRVPTRTEKRIAQGLLMAFLASYGYLFASSVTAPVLSKNERAAMAWAAANTSDGSRFALVTGVSWAGDMSSEWFPVLSGRLSAATVQGFEWFPNRQFFERRTLHETLQACTKADAACLEKWISDSKQTVDYVYLSEDLAADSVLSRTLDTAPKFEAVYSGPGAKIYRVRP